MNRLREFISWKYSKTPLRQTNDEWTTISDQILWKRYLKLHKNVKTMKIIYICINIKRLMYALKSMLKQYARFIHIHFSYLGVNWWKWIGAKNRIYWPVIFVEWVATILSLRFEWPFKKFWNSFSISKNTGKSDHSIRKNMRAKVPTEKWKLKVS